LSIDYQKTLDDILCCPEFAAEFDRLALLFGPNDRKVTSLDFRRAAVSIRKRANSARVSAREDFAAWISKSKKLPAVQIGESTAELNSPGVFLLNSGGVAFYAGEAENMQSRIEQLQSNEQWRNLETSSVSFIKHSHSPASRYALKSALAQRESPLLNCRLLIHEAELA
jgi:hypothetical protein